MSTHHEFYLERAAEAWEQMATRVERTGRMRAETEAKKAAALAEAG